MDGWGTTLPGVSVVPVTKKATGREGRTLWVGGELGLAGWLAGRPGSFFFEGILMCCVGFRGFSSSSFPCKAIFCELSRPSSGAKRKRMSVGEGFLFACCLFGCKIICCELSTVEQEGDSALRAAGRWWCPKRKIKKKNEVRIGHCTQGAK